MELSDVCLHRIQIELNFKRDLLHKFRRCERNTKPPQGTRSNWSPNPHLLSTCPPKGPPCSSTVSLRGLMSWKLERFRPAGSHPSIKFPTSILKQPPTRERTCLIRSIIHLSKPPYALPELLFRLAFSPRWPRRALWLGDLGQDLLGLLPRSRTPRGGLRGG